MVNKIKGIFSIVDDADGKALMRWAKELNRRNIPADVGVRESTMEDAGLIKELCETGLEMGTSYREAAFWNESYEFQYEKVSHLKDKLEKATKKPLRIFSSRFAAYNEDTLRVADKLGVKHITGRGTEAAAVVYKAKEHNAKIICYSSVPFKDMGKGSISCRSIWGRGAIAAEFRDIIFNLKVDRMMLSAHTYLSGVKLDWWNIYQEFLDAGLVTWQPLEEFSKKPIELPYAKIPQDTDVRYVTPKPTVPYEQQADIPW